MGLVTAWAYLQYAIQLTPKTSTTLDSPGEEKQQTIPEHMHPLEMDMLRFFAVDDTVKDNPTI